MAWTAYCVSFRSLSPIHSGWRKVGNLQQTRPYITGRTLWGALTARLTRELVARPGSEDYVRIGNLVDDQLAFTYFYPSTSSHTITLWPWPEKQWDEFAWAFLGSYASTALENGRSARAGSLHETEYISPYIRNDSADREPEPVFLVGYMFQKNTPATDEQKMIRHWKRILDTLQFGGERSYGWGKVRAEGQPVEVEDKQCFDYELNCEGEYPLLTAPASQDSPQMRLLAHTIVEKADITDDHKGREVAIEPLLTRETKQSTGFGGSFSDAEICWVPGGTVNKGERFQIQKKGIWKRYP